MTTAREKGVLAVTTGVSALQVLRKIEIEVARDFKGMYGSRHAEMQAAIDAFEELIAYADSALGYVDAAAAAERDRHRANGAPRSQVLAQIVADNLRAALARANGESP